MKVNKDIQAYYNAGLNDMDIELLKEIGGRP
jgi:hypothetical protein